MSNKTQAGYKTCQDRGSKELYANKNPSSWPWGHHYGVLGRDAGGTGLRLAESPPTYGAAGSRGWFDGNKCQKALLSTQVHPETLMAGEEKPWLSARRAKIRVPSVGGPAMDPELPLSAE